MRQTDRQGAEACIDWWNDLTPEQRIHWMAEAGSAVPADAWAAYKACDTAKAWIIQRRVCAARNEYEDWPGYTELMTRPEVLAALGECDQRWPDMDFRAHRVRNLRSGHSRLHLVR